MTSVRILWVTLLSIWLTRPDQIAATTGMTEIAIRITVTAIVTITTPTTTTVIGHRTTGALLIRVLESWVQSLEIVQSQTCLPILCKFQVCCGKLPFINHKFHVFFLLLLFYFLRLLNFAFCLNAISHLSHIPFYLPPVLIQTACMKFQFIFLCLKSATILLHPSVFSLTLWWFLNHTLKGKSFGI